MKSRIDKTPSGFFVTINGDVYVRNGWTVFSRRQAQNYAEELRSKDAERVVKVFGVHRLKENA